MLRSALTVLPKVLMADVFQPSAHVRRATFSTLVASLGLIGLGSTFLWACTTETLEAFRFVYGYTAEDAEKAFRRKYLTAVIGCAILLTAFLLRRLNFVVYTTLAGLVIVSQLSDYSGVLRLELSTNLAERYQQQYYLHLIAAASVIRVLFLATLVYGAVASFKVLKSAHRR